MNRAGRWFFAIFAVALFVGPLRAEPKWPDTLRSRREVLTLIDRLNATLLASNSATKTLEDWCASHHMAADPTLHAHLLRDMQKPLPPAERRRLKIAPGEPVIYRRVELVCGTHILSRADNWYVPARLTPDMDRLLETSDIPFGRAVENLHPHRRTFAVAILWHPLPEGGQMRPADHPEADLPIPPVLFEHRAVLIAADGMPISEVDESYTRDILDFAHDK